MQRFSIDLFEENSSSAYKCVNGETVYENEPFHIFICKKISFHKKRVNAALLFAVFSCIIAL